MGLLDSDAEEPRSKVTRWVVTAVSFVILAGLLLWYQFRFDTEKNTARRFYEALAAGDTHKAYEIWQPVESYTYDRFLEDWGPNGEFGPVKSFRIVGAEQVKRGASGVVVMAEISRDTPFPEGQPGRVQEMKVWVERSDQSISFPP